MKKIDINKMNNDQLKQHVIMLAAELAELKQRMETKDKAYMALLKDYEKLKREHDHYFDCLLEAQNALDYVVREMQK